MNDKVEKVQEKDYYSKFAISNSSLSWFKESPKYFIKQLRGEIDEEVPRKYFETGKQIHMFLLEPDEFHKNYTYIDIDKPSSQQQKQFCKDFIDSEYFETEARCVDAYKKNYKFSGKSDTKIQEEADKLYKKLKPYIDYLERSKDVKVILPWTDWEKIIESAKEVKNHKIANDLINKSEYSDGEDVEIFNELPIFWKYPGLDKVECKSMLDRLIINHTTKTIKLVDIKTTSNLSTFSKSVAKYSYNRQFAFYWMALHYFWKQNYPDKGIDKYTKETYVVAIGKQPTIEVKSVSISDKILNDGLKEIEYLMEEIKYHFETGNWDYPKEYYEGNGLEYINMEDYEKGLL